MTGVLDTGPLPAAAPETEAAPTSRATVTPGDVWRKAKLPLVIALAFTLIAFLIAVTTGSFSAARLDPGAAGPEGGMALASVLRDRGIDVRVVEAPSGAAGTTVFFASVERVQGYRPTALADARTARDVVVVAPDDAALEALDADAGVANPFMPEQVIDPGCAHPDAQAAGDVLLGGTGFSAGEAATVCYTERGDASFVELREGDRRLTLLGTGAFMTNEHLDDNGDAALALRLLTRNPTVEWVYPRIENAGPVEEEQGLTDLLPHRVFVAVAQAFVALGLLALWRARRLGPVVVEPLPVVVRAAEAVEGRARLYEAAHARDSAANALRAGLRDRLVRSLGLATDAGPEAMVGAVSTRTGRDPVAVTDLLYGAPPADDAALVRLAADLDLLDSEVRAL